MKTTNMNQPSVDPFDSLKNINNFYRKQNDRLDFPLVLT